MRQSLSTAAFMLSAGGVLLVLVLGPVYLFDLGTTHAIDQFQRSLHRGESRQDAKALAKHLGGFDLDEEFRDVGATSDLYVRFSYVSMPCTSYGPEYKIDFDDKGLSEWTTYPYHEAC